MNRLLVIELKKAIFSKTWLLSALILSLFAVCSAIYAIENWGDYNPDYLYDYCMKDGVIQYDPDFPLYGLPMTWLGADSMSLASTVFFAIVPICAAIPYAWSFRTEKKSGYLKNIAVRTQKWKYYFAKLISTFASGFLVVFVAFAINLSLITAFIPYYPPWVGYNFYNMVFFGQMWGDLFFIHPILYIILYTFLASVYGGIFAMVSLAISVYIQNVIAVLFTPFLLTIIAGYLEEIIYTNFYSDSIGMKEFVPTRFIHATQTGYMVTSAIVWIETAILFFIPIAIILWKGRKDEIY